MAADGVGVRPSCRRPPCGVAVGRTKPILATLGELFHPRNVTDGTIGISTREAARSAEVAAATKLRWFGGERLRDRPKSCALFASPDDGAAGRPARDLARYQRDGLAWLQFLREYGLGGILADDMGLGKTVQALAQSWSKRRGRLDRPCLVVCPTSVVPNWQAEAARFAPALRVLSLHGADAHERFAGYRRQRPGADHLRAAAARQRAAAAGAMASGGARRGAGDQERRGEGDTARLPARRAAPAVPDRHAAGESPRRAVVAVRLSDAGVARRREAFGRVFRTPIEKQDDGSGAPAGRG